jgi:propanol-preferring alcohol dehydrogenase
VGALVPAALKAVRPGGRVVCAGIHMSPIPSFPYEILWRERQIVSVETLPLAAANEALTRLREGRLEGAAVLVMDDTEKG